MASSIIELYVDVPADRQANIFGQFDEHLKLIRTYSERNHDLP